VRATLRRQSPSVGADGGGEPGTACGAKVPRGLGGNFAEADAPRSVFGPCTHEAGCPSTKARHSQANTASSASATPGWVRHASWVSGSDADHPKARSLGEHGRHRVPLMPLTARGSGRWADVRSDLSDSRSVPSHSCPPPLPFQVPCVPHPAPC